MTNIPTAKTHLTDCAGQRFLEVQRFDRIGALGRQALISLTALDAEFAAKGSDNWPNITKYLAAENHIMQQAAAQASLLWAFGILIGNSNMHNDNLSFTSDKGRPYALAPAYDMTCMAFAPRSGSGLPATLPAASIEASVSNDTWREAQALAQSFLLRLRSVSGFSIRFQACIQALDNHIKTASAKIDRLA